LTNGTAYSFTVAAMNGIGTGPASAPSQSVTPQAPQAIDFSVAPQRTLGEPPFAVSATGGGSGNPVTIVSLTDPVCSTSGEGGATITLHSVGICTLRASQAGSAAFTAAPDVDRSFTVIAAQVFEDGFE